MTQWQRRKDTVAMWFMLFLLVVGYVGPILGAWLYGWP